MQNLFGLSKSLPTASVSSLANGKEAFEKEDYKRALNHFRIGAEKDKDSECYYWLGAMFYAGLGTERDYDMAIPWLKKAARSDKNNAQPSFILGNIYLSGELGLYNDECYENASIYFNKAGEIDARYYSYTGDIFFSGDNGRIDVGTGEPSLHFAVKYIGKLKSYEKSLNWYLKADQNGIQDVCLKIAKIYYEGGYGIEKSLSEALLWCQKDIDLGNTSTWSLIGKIYCEGGFGIQKDYNKAIDCLKKGDYRSYLRVGEIYQYCLNPPDYRRAYFWYSKSIKKGDGCNAVAHDRLGWLYLKGLGTEKNFLLAKQHFGDFNGYSGTLYHFGLGVATDYELAYKKYSTGTNYNSGYAYNGLGLLYQGGLGVSQNHDTAMHYFKKAASLNNLAACNSIGDTYYYGLGNVEVDYDEAFYWYSRAAKGKDDNNGQFNLGIMYLEGKGTEVDYNKALVWLKRARMLGNDRAQTYIEQVERVKKITEEHHKRASELFLKEKNRQDARLQEAKRIAEEEKKKVAMLISQLEKLKSTSIEPNQPNNTENLAGKSVLDYIDDEGLQKCEHEIDPVIDTNQDILNSYLSKSEDGTPQKRFPKQFFHL